VTVLQGWETDRREQWDLVKTRANELVAIGVPVPDLPQQLDDLAPRAVIISVLVNHHGYNELNEFSLDTEESA
jgi:hypothetical protein